MIYLDLFTTVMLLNMSNLIVTYIIIVLWKNNRGNFKGLGFWTIAYVMLFFSALLASTNIFKPLFITMFISNSIIHIGVLIFLFGTSVYLEKKFYCKLNILILIISNVSMLLTTSIVLRTVVLTIAFLIYCSQIVYYTYKTKDAKSFHQMRGIRLSALLVLLIYIVKLIYVLCNEKIDPLCPETTYFTISIALTTCMIILLTFGIVTAISEKIKEQALQNLKDKEKAYDLLEIQSSLDGLTGIYNRMKISELLEQEKKVFERHKRSFSILMIDVDYFKKVNDTYGHQIGDVVLMEIANLINDNLRIDDHVGRWGGEEFLVILKELNYMQGKEVAEKIKNIINIHDFSLDESVTISVGVACYNKKQLLEDLINIADKALYKAKKLGRNRVE